MAALALGAWPLAAQAAPPEPAVASAQAAPIAAHAPHEESYRELLTASYVLAPLSALALGGALSALEVSDDVAVLAGSTLFLAPAAVHLAHGKSAHGPLSFLALAGATGAGLLLGGVTGHFIDAAGCDPNEDSEGCDVFTTLDGIFYGAAVGAAVGYTGFAILDVSMNGAIPLEEVRAARATLQLWVSPVPAARSDLAASAPAFSGVQLGATLQK